MIFREIAKVGYANKTPPSYLQHLTLGKNILDLLISSKINTLYYDKVESASAG